MKQIIETTPIDHTVSEDKTIEILAHINQMWDEFYSFEELAAHIENGYIFGPYGISEHYSRDL